MSISTATSIPTFPSIVVVLDSAVGPHVTYSADDDAEAVDREIPAGYSVDYSSQIKLADGNFRAPLVCTDGEDESEPDDDDLIDAAAEHIGALRYRAETVFAYVDANTPDVVHLVDVADMRDLGERLARGDADAYSTWCSETTTESVAAQDVVKQWRKAGATLTDVRALSVTAGEHGDILTVAACDLLGERIAELLA